MKTPPSSDSAPAAIRQAAARWIVRRDRGLSATEAIEFELWLAADERHAAAVKQSSTAWSLLDQVPQTLAEQTLDTARRRRSFWHRAIATSSLAAAIAVMAVVWRPREPTALIHQTEVTPRSSTLSDGTLVHLNFGSQVAERFSANERRVQLVQGEAHFTVTKDPTRPFIVQAGTVEVRAVGTAFNVNLRSAAVEVLVTEGRVQVAKPLELREPALPDRRIVAASAARGVTAEMRAGQRVVLALKRSADSALDVAEMTAEEISRSLAWQEPLLRLGGGTLAEVAVAFESRTGCRVIFADPTLAKLRLGGRFRADDIDGFTHLLTLSLGIEVERVDERTFLLRKKNASSR